MSLGVRLTASTQLIAINETIRIDENQVGRKRRQSISAKKFSGKWKSLRRNEAVGVLSHERLIARTSNAGNSVPGLVIGSSRLCSRFARTQTLTPLATDGAEVLLDAVQPDSVHGRVGHDMRKLHRALRAIAFNAMCALPLPADYFFTFASIAFLASSCVYSWLATPPTGMLGSAASKSS